MPSLFETRGRLQTSATDTTCEQPTGTLDPRRDGGRDLLPFLTHHAFSLARAVARGELRCARTSSPSVGSSHAMWVCPTVMPERSPHHEDVLRRPVHSEDRRARVEGPSEGRVYRSACDDLSCLRRCIRFEARMRDDVPLLSNLRTSAVAGAPWKREEPATDDGPTQAFVPTTPREERRLPDDQDAFDRHATWRSISRRDRSLRPPRRLSRSRRPHVIPRRGTCFWMGIARSRCGHPRIREHREYRRLLDSLDFPCLGLTTQARHRARPTRPSTGTDCPARTDAGRSA